MKKAVVSRNLTRRTFVAAAGVSAAVARGANAAEEPALPKKSNFGQCPDDQSLRDAWDEFCRTLQEAGHGVFKQYNPPTPLMRADGFRFLTQNLSQAFVMAYETGD